MYGDPQSVSIDVPEGATGTKIEGCFKNTYITEQITPPDIQSAALVTN